MQGTLISKQARVHSRGTDSFVAIVMELQTSEIANNANVPLAPPPPIGNNFESQLNGVGLKVTNRHISESSKLVLEHLCHLNKDDSEVDDNMSMRKSLSETVLRMSFK